MRPRHIAITPRLRKAVTFKTPTLATAGERCDKKPTDGPLEPMDVGIAGTNGRGDIRSSDRRTPLSVREFTDNGVGAPPLRHFHSLRLSDRSSGRTNRSLRSGYPSSETGVACPLP